MSLTEDELAILAKGPKFAVRQQILKENFKVEVEKMICKKKFGDPDLPELSPAETNSKNTSSSMSSSVRFCPPNQKQTLKDFSTANDVTGSNGGKISMEQTSLDWESKRGQLVYDFMDCNLNPNRLRATDYRFNRSSNLPKPQEAGLEIKHELRKSESIKVFDKLFPNPAGDSSKANHLNFANKSNLSPNELKGLKSLQKRVASGEIIICETDKSSRLCVLTKDQYISSGLQHCNKDLEISLPEVIRLQKYVNSNVDWLHEIFGTGSKWGHESRIKNSSQDLGAQAAPLRLLIKDHKQWSKSSGKPLPSRPVINGKAGYNSHLSEILSMVLGPIAKEASGAEINSTGDLLAKIEDVNHLIESGQVSSQKENYCELDGSKFDEDDQFCDFCNFCNKPPPSKDQIEQAKNLIDRVSNKPVRSAMHASNNLKLKLKASRAATQLYHRCCIGPPPKILGTKVI